MCLIRHVRTLRVACLSLCAAWGCNGELPNAQELDPNQKQGYVPADVAAAIAPAPTLHRLNRIEYNNTVRDLTGTTLRPADNFPPDPVANGFDNMAGQLGLTANQISAYFSAARDVVDDALDDRPALQVIATPKSLSKQGGYAIGTLWALTGNPASVDFEVSQAGPHIVEFVLGAGRVGPAPAPTAELRLDGGIIEAITVGGSSAAPQTLTYTIALQPGVHSIAVTPTNWVNMAAENTSNNVFLASIRVTSERIVTAPGRDRIITCEDLEQPSCYSSVVERFASRAWRRPLAKTQIDALVSLGTSMTLGESTLASLKLVLRAILTSPRFLFRARTSADLNASGWVDPYVLASRLSYFLWSSAPDDRLLEAAASGSLTSDEGLSHAVAWMIADPKAQALRDSFAAQWLSVREFQRANPSAEAFPSFSEAIKDEIAQESLLFFEDFVTNALPVTAMLTPDFRFRSDLLAAHYQEPSVGLDVLGRVPTTEDQRRGLLSLGAWLVARSTSTHASPIRRGAWLSEHVLCQPVNPPPAGLEIPDLDLGAEEQTVREQLEQHRSDARCASCHERLDIVGMGFQLFDAVGVQSSDPAIDSTGELPDGTTFRGAAEFADLQREDVLFARCMAEKLYTYALGRGVQPKDAPYLEELASTVQQAGLTLPQLIDAIVQLPSFRAATPLEETAP